MTSAQPRRSDHRSTAEELKDELLALVSHELRSPLTIITGAGRILDRHPVIADDAGLRVVIDDLIASTRRMERVVANMLALARLTDDAGESEPVLVRAAVDDAAAGARRDYPGFAHRVLATTDRGAAIFGVPNWTRLILLNLFTNAYLYGNRERPVVVNWRERGPVVDIQVCNSGETATPEMLGRWFEPFYRAETAPVDRHGAGLGLTVARTLARTQGGDLLPQPWDAEPGTMMTLSLPSATGA